MRVLLVDDDPRLLRSTLRVLRLELDRSWDFASAESGAEALASMQARSADVLLTDMRMPEMNGAELLAQVHALHPQGLRIVFSGQMDDVTAARAAMHAHKFLSKPIAMSELIAILRRAHELWRTVDDDTRRRLNALSTLPITGAVMEALKDAPLDRVIEIVRTQPALAAKVLQLVNGGFFGNGDNVCDLREATLRLGYRTFQTLLSEGVLAVVSEEGLDVESAALRAQRTTSSHAYAAALLADIDPYLLGIWGLPPGIVEERDESAVRGRRDLDAQIPPTSAA